jgi:hypothetical protein
MRLNWQVTGWGLWVMGAVILATTIYSMARYGTVPKREHLRDPRGVPYAAFWNFLSAEKWTPEGLAFHRRVIRFSVRSFVGLLTLWLVLDALT